MNNIYKTVISRDEFINLYRFGMININRNFLLIDSDDIENNLIELFKILSFNEASNYLILTILDKFYNKSFNKSTYSLNLQNMKRVEVLSEKAERFYRTKVNSKITYYLTEYTNILPEIEKYYELNNMKRGVEILFEQFDIPKNIIEKDSTNELLTFLLKKNNYPHDTYQKFEFDLLSYNRKNKLKKEDVSFIYDLMIISILQDRKSERISKFKQGLLNLNSSSTYKILNEIKNKKLIDYLSFIHESNDENIKKFLKKISFENLIIGSIFLKIKSLLYDKEANQEYWNDIKIIVSTFKEKYAIELGKALHLIGLFFGYRELYDDYYNFLNKKEEEIKDKIEISEKDNIENILEKLKLEKAEAEKKLEKLQSEKDESEKKAKEELEKLKDNKIHF